MPKLTKTLVEEAAAVNGKPTFLWDTSMKGFGLLVSPSGVKSFVVQYRPKDKRQARRVSLGRVGPAFDLPLARGEAKKLLGKVAQGGDPVVERQDAKKEQTVSGLMLGFITDHVEKYNKPSTARCEIALIERFITGRKSDDPKRRLSEASFGKMRVSELTTPKVKAWFKGIKSNISANRALAHLSRACRTAIEDGLLTSNPCRGIQKNPEIRCNRAFSDDELVRIGQALRELEDEGRILPTVALGIRLLAVTGLRPGEIRLAKWTDYNPQLRLLKLPDSKTGPRGVRLHPPAVALLEGATRVGPFIMAGSDPEKPVNDSRFAQLVKVVLTRAKVEDAHPHVFRHTMVTFAAEHGATDSEIMAIGGWETRAMVTRYTKLTNVGEHRHPLPAAARIAQALDGAKGNVVSLTKAA